VETEARKEDAAVPIADAALQAAREVSPATKRRRVKGGEAVQLRIPNIEDYLPGLTTDTRPSRAQAKAVVNMEVGSHRSQQHSPPKPPRKLKRPELSGPRPRKRTRTEATNPSPSVPEELRSLVGLGNDTVLEKYYQRSRGESKEQMLSRITNPELSLEEAAKLLGVCPATVRRYTNKGWLRHHRTKGNQRRFRLSDIAEFVREFRAKLE
jgi:excisionase family DNA binding protein